MAHLGQDRLVPCRRFSDIPQFTQWGGYSIDVTWPDVDRQLISMGEGWSLEMNPDFQRGHVWDDGKRIRYVEYILRGGRAARDILWNCANWQVNQVAADDEANKMVLVDGKQRLEAARMFLANEIPAFGTLFRDFEDRMRGLSGPAFKFHINSLARRADVLAWYIDLNSGGVVHSDDEIERVRALLAAERSKGREGA